MLKTRLPLLLAVVFFLAMGIGWSPGAPAGPVTAKDQFSLALLGDMPYSKEQEAGFTDLIARINKEDVAFVVHDGDTKSGSSPCSDDNYLHIKDMFRLSVHPLIYIPGDNEWTDCHRKDAGGYGPEERLARLRTIFWQGDESLGQHKLKLVRQSRNPAYEKFVENISWIEGPVIFVGLNMPGSNNNLGRSLEGDAEYRERNAANLAWLQESFQVAKAQHLKGVMIIIQANPGFDLKPNKRTGYNDFLGMLTQQTLEFARQVVLVHGDTHYFRIDKPMRHPVTGLQIMNFTRVETFGSPDIHWVHATVDPKDPNVFTFRPRV